MITDRYDPFQEKYAKAELIENVSRWLFWAATACFLIKIATHWVPGDQGQLIEQAQHWSEWGFVIFTVLAFALLQLGRFYMHELGDQERRKLLLSDGLGVELSMEAPRKYYNNTEAQSSRRLLFNLAESIFFSQALLRVELRRALAITLLSLAILIVSLWTAEPSLVEFAAVVLFCSDFVLGRYVKLRWATSRLAGLSKRAEQLATQPLPQQQLKHAMQVNGVRENHPLSPNQFLYMLIEIACEYDNIKARTGVRASEQVFEQLNGPLSAEWREKEKSFCHEKRLDPNDVLLQ